MPNYTGTNGDDYWVGTADAETASGGPGNDSMYAQGGDDIVNGESGDDRIEGREGNDQLNGGDGNDTIYGDFGLTFPALAGNDLINGGAGNDSLFGEDRDDTINGGADRDFIFGGQGADIIDGGDGDDYISGAEYSSNFDSANDVLRGGAGDDRIFAQAGDTVDGGTGFDTVWLNLYSGATTGVTADFRNLANNATVIVGSATITNIEAIGDVVLTPFDDVFVAGAVNGIDRLEIRGEGGNDDLTGSAGVDMINGGEGNDIIRGGIGSTTLYTPSLDQLIGGQGNDTIYIGADGASAFGGSGDDVVYGGAAADDIRGDDGADRLFGAGGDDYLEGGAGNDTIDGGDESDMIVGASGADEISGGRGNDSLYGGADGDLIHGDDGDDVIRGGDWNFGDGADTLFGDAGNDMINGELGGDTLYGGDGNDFLFANAGSRYFAEIAASDYIFGNIVGLGDYGTDVDTLSGGAGDDQLFVGFGDSVDGNTGNDTLYLFLDGSTSGITADFRLLGMGATVVIGGGVIRGIETVALVDGTDFDDDITGNNGGTFGTRLYGNSGNDRLVAGTSTGEINGGVGNDFIDGRAAIQSTLLVGAQGTDTIFGSASGDIIAGGSGSDVIEGGDGDDILYTGFLSPAWSLPNRYNPWEAPILDTGSEVDTVRGGAGVDTIFAGFGDIVDGGADQADLLISLMGSSAGITVDFRALDNGGTLTLGGNIISSIRSIRWIEGTNFDDVITGSDQHYPIGITAAPIFGGGGNDRLIAGLNTGDMFGGDGNDVLELNQNYFGGPSNNSLYGEAGNDTINATYTGVSSPSVSAYGGDGDDTINVSGGYASGGTGNDVITAAAGGIYTLVAEGNSGDDRLTGADSGDSLYGGTGADVLTGNGANDRLFSDGPRFDFDNPLVEADTGVEHDVLSGGSGDDRLSIGYGDDADGGSGFNALALSLIGAGSGITLNVADLLTGNPYVLGSGTIRNIQDVVLLWGSNFADTLTLATPIAVYGLGGNDTIIGSTGADLIHGGAGADVINAGDGNDSIFIDDLDEAASGEVINGGAGTDTLVAVGHADLPDDSYYDLSGVTLTGIENLASRGNAGFGIAASQLAGITTLDGQFVFTTSGTVTLAGISASSVSFTLNPGGNRLDLTGFTANSFLIVGGGANADIVIGSAGSDNVYAREGDDVLNGNAGSDNLVGGDGNDVINGGADGDYLDGEVGNDIIDGGTGADSMAGGDGDDLFIVDNIDDIVRESENGGIDTVRASVTFFMSDTVENLELTGTANIDGFGNASVNVLTGNDGNNLLRGEAGDDRLIGGGGDDRLVGGAGNDILDGGTGIDTVLYTDSLGAVIVNLGLAGTQNTVGSGTDVLINIENLTGSGFADQLSGDGNANTLTGRAGVDTLTGGGGSDSFQDTTVNLNGDTITDFAVGDRIVFTNATLATFNFSLSGSTLTFSGGSLTLTGGIAGTLVASAAASGGVQLTINAAPAIADVRNDFNGDGRSDILWRNVDGQLSNWLGQANGGFVANNANAAAVVPTSWQIAGTGDFNGDGRDDILWRNVDGQLSNWLATASGGFTQNNANAAAVVPTAWSVAGTGDFNGDGRDDILWRNTNGTVSDWLGQANGGFVANDVNAARFVPTSWSVVGTGDFNGDGRDDILWRNSNGQLSDWLGQANGGFVLNDAIALTQVDTAWSVAGTGDFNGDGRDDILWRNTNGTISTWSGQANGGFVNNGAISGVFVPLAWSVVAVGDYNGDGRDDILWRNADGTVTDWLANPNGSFTPNDAAAAQSVPTAWHVQPEAPFI